MTRCVPFNAAKTNRERVLAYLATHGSLSPMRALTEWGETRLAARIEELRIEGWRITTTICHALNGKRYAEYDLSLESTGNYHLSLEAARKAA